MVTKTKKMQIVRGPSLSTIMVCAMNLLDLENLNNFPDTNQVNHSMSFKVNWKTITVKSKDQRIFDDRVLVLVTGVGRTPDQPKMIRLRGLVDNGDVSWRDGKAFECVYDPHERTGEIWFVD